MPDPEHVPNKPGKKNWVEKTGGLPEYINRIAKDLMDKGMTESHAIATAVNTVKRWARGGGKVTPKTRAKAAAALAEWESKKAASHVGLSTPTRLERTRHARLRSMDLAAVLDRASSIADPEARDRTTYRLLDLAGTQALTPKSYNIDRVRDAYSGMQSKKRQAFYARQAKQREAAGTLGSPMVDSPSSGPAYRYVKEVWNTHLIVKDDNNGLFKVPYTVGNSGADISFGNEVPVTEQYVELSDPADGWLADLDDRGNVTALAGEVFDLAFGQAESSGTATTSAALKTAYTARDAKAAKAVARKRAAGSRKTKRRARKGSTLHATQVRVGAKMRAMAAAEAHPGQPASKAIRDAVKVHQAQERVQAKTEATGSGTGGAKWAHGWVPLNDAAKRQVAANPEKFKQMRKKQKKQAKSVSLSAALDRAALIEDPAAKVAARLAILDLAKPGQRYRHGWIRIDGAPIGKSRPKVAGSRGLKVDGLTKEQHSARVDRIAAIPRTERTRKQQDQFVRSNAVLRGEAVPARSSAPVGAEAVASQAATQAGINARKARKGLPARQTPGSTGGMTPSRKIASASGGNEVAIQQTQEAMRAATNPKHAKELEARLDRLHTERGEKMWPGLSPEAARHRSVQDHQLRTGAVSVGQNWERPAWYTGPEPKRVKQGSGGFEVTAPRSEDPIGDAMRNAPRGRPARPPLSRRQTLAELNTKERKAARKNAPDPVAEAMRNAPAGKPSAPIPASKAQSELDARDAKASDRLIAEMPSMSEEHLRIALNSPSTSQKVKDAAQAELAKRSPKSDKPWSEIPADYKTTINGVRHVMSGEGGTHLRPYRDPAGSASDAMSARTVSVRAGDGGAPMDRGTFKALGIKHGDPIEIAGPRGNNHVGTAVVRGSEVGVLKEDGKVHSLGGTATKVVGRKVDHSKIPPMSTPAHPNAYGVERFERPQGASPTPIFGYRALGRDGKPLGSGIYFNSEAAAKKYAESHRPPAHREPGAAASVAPTKIDPTKLANVSTEDLQSVVRTGNWGGTPVHPDSMPKIEAEISRRAGGATPGAHPEKFKPGEKPPVHKFMNTERLQQIAADTSNDPEKQANAAKAKEILAKRGKSAGVPQAPPPAGLSSSNDAARGMTERILAKREANAPQVMNPRTPTGTSVIKHPTKGGLWLTGPDGEYPVPAEAQKSTEALQKWTDDNLHRVDAEGARGRALQKGAPKVGPFGVTAVQKQDSSYRSGLRTVYQVHDADGNPVATGYATKEKAERAAATLKARHSTRDTSSADITNARAAAGTPDTNVGNARLARVSTSTLQNWQRSGTPSQKVMAAQELRRREQPVRGGSVAPPRPIGGAHGQGSAQTGRPVPESRAGSSNAAYAREQVVFIRDAARKTAAELNDMSSADLAKIVASSFAPRNLKNKAGAILNRRRNA